MRSLLTALLLCSLLLAPAAAAERCGRGGARERCIERKGSGRALVMCAAECVLCAKHRQSY